MKQPKDKHDSLPTSFLKLTGDLTGIFCEMLRINPLDWFATKDLWESGNAWHVHRIPKKRGFRIIHVPSDPLKRIQRGILEQLLRTFPVHRCVHGAHPSTSILTNARLHAGFGQAFYVLDLKNAFPSVTRLRVERYFETKLRDRIEEVTGLVDKDAKKLVDVIFDLIHVDDVLPQGFPTSPAVLNLVALPLDREIMKVLDAVSKTEKIQFRYTRFVDDLTISTSHSSISESLRHEICKAITNAGWKIQHAKVRYHGLVEEGTETERSTHMPIVTGLVPQYDGRVTIPRWKLNTYRARLHQLLELPAPLPPEAHDEIVGIVGFVGMVYDDQLPSIIKKSYLEAKQKFGLGERRERTFVYPEPL